ncbi:TPA: hypothetical protein ACXNPR_001801 [Enterobacter cancerogenus]
MCQPLHLGRTSQRQKIVTFDEQGRWRYTCWLSMMVLGLVLYENNSL